MKGFGSYYLRELFDSIKMQTFKYFEVCISDHSMNNDILEVCEEYANYFEIKYFKNEEDRGNGPANTNSVVEMCSCPYTKLIFADDLFINENALELIVQTFNKTNCDWSFSGFKHTSDGKVFVRPMIPRWTDMLLEGRNLMGSPSCVAFKTNKFLCFDPKVKLLMDTDFYYRMRCEYGMPKIIEEYLIANREHPNRVTESHNYNYRYDHPEGSWIVVKEEVDYLLEKNKDKKFLEDS
jgi:glycosyltransferase involved in cell wall biosynthesis